MTREQLIEKNKALFWYTPEAEKQNISDALLVETLLNYGTLDDYRELISVLGGKQVAKVFLLRKADKKTTIIPKSVNFFH